MYNYQADWSFCVYLQLTFICLKRTGIKVNINFIIFIFRNMCCKLHIKYISLNASHCPIPYNKFAWKECIPLLHLRIIKICRTMVDIIAKAVNWISLSVIIIIILWYFKCISWTKARSYHLGWLLHWAMFKIWFEFDRIFQNLL